MHPFSFDVHVKFVHHTCAGQPKFPSKEHYNYLFDVLNSGSTSGDNPKYPVNNCGDHERLAIFFYCFYFPACYCIDYVCVKLTAVLLLVRYFDSCFA